MAKEFPHRTKTTCSSREFVESVHGGVPEGTVLGPILFITMLNDLLEVFDDTTLTETLIRDQPSSLQTILNDILTSGAEKTVCY